MALNTINQINQSLYFRINCFLLLILINWRKNDTSGIPFFFFGLSVLHTFRFCFLNILTREKNIEEAVIVWLVDLQLPVQSVPITTKGVSLNPVHGKVYWNQHYLIKFVSELLQVSGFLRVL